MDTTLQVLFEAYQEHPIAYMPIYSRVTGSVTAGILLSQIVYWDGKMQHREFYKTDKDFSEELSMGLSELKNAKKRLIKIGLVDVVRRGIPAKTHYKLNLAKLADVITTFVKKTNTVSRKTQNKINQKITTNTDTTQNTIPNINLYAFLNQKSKHDKDTIENFLIKYPSNNGEINPVIQFYQDRYLNKIGKDHPEITLEQYLQTVSMLEQEADHYEIGTEELKAIISSWFEDPKVKSNYNIIHFASEGVLKTHYHKSGVH